MASNLKSISLRIHSSKFSSANLIRSTIFDSRQRTFPVLTLLALYSVRMHHVSEPETIRMKNIPRPLTARCCTFPHSLDLSRLRIGYLGILPWPNLIGVDLTKVQLPRQWQRRCRYARKTRTSRPHYRR